MPPKWKSPVISVPSGAGAEQKPQPISVAFSGWYGLAFSCKEKCECVFSAFEASNSDKALLSLPRQEGKDKVSSIEIGALVYLDRSSNVTVSLRSSCDLHADHTPPFDWCLFLQYKGERDKYTPKKTLMCAECARMFSSLHAIQSHIETMHRVPDPSSIWNIPLKVIYEDKFLAIVDKPQGMAVMGERPSLCRSDLLQALVGKSDDAMTKPVHIHRLDAPTGGLLVLAKTKAAEVELKKCFVSRSCRKRYLALTLGRIEPPEGTIDEAISRKPATTHYKVVQYTRCIDNMATGGWVTLVDLHPMTGRQHQIRRHLKYIDHPIWGDKRYAPYRKCKAPSETVSDVSKADLINSTTVEKDPHARLCLWAVEITFPHPETGVDLTATLKDSPDWLESLLAYQEKCVKQEEQ